MLADFFYSSLSNPTVYLSLLGTFFAALAGLGLGLILDNVDPSRTKTLVGVFLLGTGLPLFVILSYSGLHT